MSPRGFTRRGRLALPSQRRKTGWGLGPGQSAVTTITATGSTILGAGSVSTADGQTVVRLRGELLLWLSLAAAAVDGFSGAFGIGIVQNPAFTAGIASVPTPVTEAADENWLYHRFFACKTAELFATGAEPAGRMLPAFLRLEVDSKAMRKFDAGVTLYAAVEVTEVGTATMQVHFDSRVLVKLA